MQNTNIFFGKYLKITLAAKKREINTESKGIMLMKNTDRWFAIVNPNSGKGRTKKNWPNLYQRLRHSDVDIEYEYTSRPEEGAVLAEQAQINGFRKIIAVGGDGTVNEVLNGLFNDNRLIHEDTKFAILEHGTGSDFVRSFQQKKGIDNFIKLLRRNKTERVDIGRIDYTSGQGDDKTRYFVNALNIGIGAEVVERVNNRNKALSSKLSYFTGTISTLLNFKRVDVMCTLGNGERIEDRFSGIVICNGRYIGGGMHIAPQAQISDGRFDVVFIKDISNLKLFTKFPTIYFGKHINLPEIAIYQTEKLTLHTKENSLLEADGEIVGFTPFECQIVPKALTLLV